MFLLLILSLVCYVLISVYLIWALSLQKPIHKGVTLGFLAVGSLAHAGILLPKIITLYGLNFNLFNMISLTSLFMLLFYWGFSWYRAILPFGVFAAPLALIGVLTGYFGKAPYQPLTDMSAILQGHILLALAAYSILFMSAVQAVILRLQIRELKHQTIHRIWVAKLPALQDMENLLFDMITLGFVLLSASLGLGFMDTRDLLGQHLAHKTAFSVLSWLVFGLLLFGHWRYGWRGIKASNMTLYGVVLLGIAFIGTKFVLEVILN
ncbi:cytochrome c assembly protein [Moraxella macacae 0408225]|uniref:Cytochrome c assembly protein n=1 Tax=Moraxella macacae 0408225 TaxID=1230338 RepID=L2F820_9GAMM|nr:cytochrome c biogenesis protein CcsA [Moraxella macacae]ELA09045.1 cytochrome c assembly protein [Moraxella macacae 0408225]